MNNNHIWCFGWSGNLLRSGACGLTRNSCRANWRLWRWWKMMECDVMWCHVMSCDVMSCHVMLCCTRWYEGRDTKENRRVAFTSILSWHLILACILSPISISLFADLECHVHYYYHRLFMINLLSISVLTTIRRAGRENWQGRREGIFCCSYCGTERGSDLSFILSVQTHQWMEQLRLCVSADVR